MENIEPDVGAVVVLGTTAIVLVLPRYQLERRRPGDLVTAQILDVIPTQQSYE